MCNSAETETRDCRDDMASSVRLSTGTIRPAANSCRLTGDKRLQSARSWVRRVQELRSQKNMSSSVRSWLQVYTILLNASQPNFYQPR